MELIEARDRLFREEPWEWIAGEQLFSIDVPGVPIPYMGFIDGFGRDLEGQKKFSLMEEKTNTKPWLFNAHPNGQIIGYAYVARSLFEQDVRRVRVTMAGIYKSSEGGRLPPKKKGD